MNPDLGPEIIVAGGYGDGDHLDSVDIYTVNTDTWRAGDDISSFQNITWLLIVSLLGPVIQVIHCQNA